MSPNRIVALLTPVCALAAGWVASWIAQNFPDANISKESLQAVFIGGVAAVLAPAWQWLHGWQKYEARQAEAEQLALASDAALSTAVGGYLAAKFGSGTAFLGLAITAAAAFVTLLVAMPETAPKDING